MRKTVPLWLAALVILAVGVVSVIVIVASSGPHEKTPDERYACEMEKVLAGRSLYESEMLCK